MFSLVVLTFLACADAQMYYYKQQQPQQRQQSILFNNYNSRPFYPQNNAFGYQIRQQSKLIYKLYS